MDIVRPSPTVLTTPDDISFGCEKTSADVGDLLAKELNNNGWSLLCNQILKENPKYLFLYDQFENILQKAFGSADLKIAYNPLHVQCLHPDCTSVHACKRPVKLKYMFVLTPFLDHLRDHHDRVGEAMRRRFDAVSNNKFITEEKLDKLSVSPYNLLGHNLQLGHKAVEYINRYAVNRDFDENYICHWKNILIRNGAINSSSLTFQEDDARIFMALSYPHPISNWDEYNTLHCYGLKMLVGESANAVNLFRGSTHYPRLSNKESADMKTFMTDLNHPCAGVSTLQRFLLAWITFHTIYLTQIITSLQHVSIM